MRGRSAFTLVEIMIVVSIIALLAMIAVPSFMRARERSRAAMFINDLRIATSAFELYAMEHNGSYPPDVSRAIVPAGMATYFGPKLQFTRPTPIGGNWDWDGGAFGFTANVSVVGAPLSNAQMIEIDTQIDDGNLTTGKFRSLGGGRYTDIIQD